MDNLKLLLLIISLSIQVFFASSLSKSQGIRNRIYKKSEGFLLTVPATIQAGKNETVCVSLHQMHLPAKISVELRMRDKRKHVFHQQLHSDSQCFKLEIPWRKHKGPELLSVRAKVQTNGNIYTAHNQDPVMVYPREENRVLVQTDRSIYKPGDLVKFFVLQLDEEFKPVSRKIDTIKIRNPMGIVVMAWEKSTPDHGLISLDYQLVSEAITGKWLLHVDDHAPKHFEVAKYTTPRFKIEIEYPKAVYYRSNYVTVSVCGKYSYNKPVAGLGFVQITDSTNNMSPVHRLNELVNGCTDFKLNQSELALDRLNENSDDPLVFLQITATVTEFGTNKVDVATGKSKIVYRAYNLKFQSSVIFSPGVPYRGQLKLINAVGEYTDDVIEICCNLAVKKSWNYVNDEQCRNYTIGEGGVVPFTLWPFKSSVLHVHLHARSLNNSLITDKLMLVRLFSASSSYIQLEREQTPAVNHQALCHMQYRYKVSYSSDNFENGDQITFYYMVKSPTELLLMSQKIHAVQKMVPDHFNDKNLYLGEMHKYVKFATSTDHFHLDFELHKKFVSRFQLVVYYVTKDGETVAATKSEDVQPCTLKVNSFWTEPEVLPGHLSTFNIKSTSPALCAVSAIDRASRFMSANGHFTLEKVLRAYASERESLRSGRNSCIFSTRRTTGLQHLDTRRKRHVYSFAEDFDAYDIFWRFGTVTLTNLQMVTKPCYSDALVNGSTLVQMLTDHQESTPADDTHSSVRSFFPETWLWELVPVRDVVQLQRTAPHSITSWIANVFCVSEEEGLGFSPETELTSFQPFFVEVLTPYSIKKGENFHLLVHVSNYMNNSIPIKISIRMSDNLQLVTQMSATCCIQANGTKSQNYPIVGLEIGKANVTVLVENDNQYQFPCGPENTIPRRDVVVKSFNVEPEGYFVQNTKSALLCGSRNDFPNNMTWHLRVPRDIVEGTHKVVATVNADLLSHTVENLNRLLTIPTGCGEQIMASMAPNIYILRYLNVTDGLSSSIKQKILRNLKMGYQRILNYAHADGSFSAFGYYDPSGSMFLTAFVVKVLQEAKDVIYVDQRVIDRAVKWIFSNQLENGCFDTMHHVFQDMGGTDRENSTAGLTAYVILSLFEAKVNVPDAVQTNAKYCIRNQENPDKYSLVISSYALFKVYWITEAKRLLEKAISVSNKENNLMWWSTRGEDDSSASDIEITSYALLALMEQKRPENMAFAHSIAQWLASKMSPSGAFRSTQDTIVALDAITRYSEFTRHGGNSELNLTVSMNAHEQNHLFVIKTSDRLKSKQVALKAEEGEVNITIAGSGCVLAQLTTDYYTTEISETDAFTLALEISPVSTLDQCSIKTISPCLAYQGPDNLSNMAVMEVMLPSGFVADRSSLYASIEQDESIKMFEERDDQINFYFTNLGRNQVCFSFNINERSIVDNIKENVVKLYNYYRPEQSILQFYKVVNNCSREGIEGIQDAINGESAKPEKTIENDSAPYVIDVMEKVPHYPRLGVTKRRRKRDSETEMKTKVENPLRKQILPKCFNVPFYASSERNKKEFARSKAKRETLLNKDFVDLDVDMEAPNCVNIPFYIPQPTAIVTHAKSGQEGKIMVRHSTKGPHPLQPRGL